MNKPLVTIITATYNPIKANRKEYFLQAIESVKNQTYENIEHIIIDGGSNDGTLELIQSTGLKYISEPDKGIFDAFNKGVLNANGKYIAFLNSDDFYNNNDAIKISVEKLEETQADFSFGTTSILNKDDELIKIYKPEMHKAWNQAPFVHLTMFTKTEVIKKENLFDLNYKIAADYDLILRLLIKKYKYVDVKANIASFRNIGISCNNEKESYCEQIKIFMNLYSKFMNFPELMAKDVLRKKRVPIRLLLKMKITNPKAYLYSAMNKYDKKKILSCRFNIKTGFEYIYIFGKHFGKGKRIFYEDKIDAILSCECKD